MTKQEIISELLAWASRLDDKAQALFAEGKFEASQQCDKSADLLRKAVREIHSAPWIDDGFSEGSMR